MFYTYTWRQKSCTMVTGIFLFWESMTIYLFMYEDVLDKVNRRNQNRQKETPLNRKVSLGENPSENEREGKKEGQEMQSEKGLSWEHREKTKN